MVGAAWSAGALGAAPGGAASKKSMAEARAGLPVPGGASSVPGGRSSMARAASAAARRLMSRNEGVLASYAAALRASSDAY